MWQDRVDGRWRVEESHLATGRWTRAHPLGWGEHPHTTIDGRGTTTVVWSARGIRSARRGTAGPWRYEPVARPSSPRLLRVASNADGDVATAWVERGRVRSALRPHGTGWTGASTFRLSPRELPIVTGVQVAVDRTGRALAVWSTTGVWHDRAHEYANYVAWSRSTPTGTWSSPRRVTRALGEDGGGLSMSMNPAGAALATWVRVGRSDSYASQWAARFRPDGTWTTPTRIPGRDVSWWGALAWLDPRGEAHAVLDRGWGNLVASYQPPGGRWSPGKVVAPGSALDADGRSRTFLVLYAPYHPGDTLRAIAWTAPR